MKQQTSKKPTKMDQITAATRQEYINQHSLRVVAKRAILLFEEEKIEGELVALNGMLVNARERRAEIAAMVAGLNHVMNARSAS